MSQAIMNHVESKFIKKDMPEVHVGDTVDVHCRIIEGDKERMQTFGGVVLAIKGSGVTRNITVRRIVSNEGVERIFPINSPKVASIDVVRRAHVRRAKLHYLRDRVGKARRLRDQRRGLAAATAPEAAPAAAAPEATKA